MTPPIKILAPSQTYLFPEGVSQVDINSIEEFSSRFESEFGPSFAGFEWDRQKAADFGARLFGNGNFRSCTNFKKTTLTDAVPIPWIDTKLDVSIEKGAKVCADFETEKGVLLWPDPVALKGFSLFGIRPDRVRLDDGGRLKAGTGCCLSTDITDKVLQSRIKPLFPEGKVTDLPLERIFLFEPPPLGSVKTGGLFSQVLKAVDLIGLWGEVCTDSQCAGLKAGLALYFDFPMIRETLESGRFKAFDFTGVRKDSFIDWPNFSLSLLPLPEGIKIPEGTADLSWRYDPDTKTTAIGID